MNGVRQSSAKGAANTASDSNAASPAASSDSSAKAAPAAGSAEAFKEAKARNAALKKRKAAIEKTEAEIQKLETRVKEIDEAFLDPSIQTNAYKLRLLQEEKDDCEAKLLELMDQWEQLESEQLEG